MFLRCKSCAYLAAHSFYLFQGSKVALSFCSSEKLLNKIARSRRIPLSAEKTFLIENGKWKVENLSINFTFQIPNYML